MQKWIKENPTAIITFIVLSVGLVGNYQISEYKMVQVEKVLEERKTHIEKLDKIDVKKIDKIDKIELDMALMKQNQQNAEIFLADLKELISKNTEALNNNTTMSKLILEKLESLDHRVDKLEEK